MKKTRFIPIILAILICLSSCGKAPADHDPHNGESAAEQEETDNNESVSDEERPSTETQGNKDENSLEETEKNNDTQQEDTEDHEENIQNPETDPTDDSKNEDISVTADIALTCLSGTKNCYTLKDDTLYFAQITEDTVYSLSGEFFGSIIIDVGDEYKFELQLNGFSLTGDSTNPIIVNSGDKITITAKSGTENFITDNREAVDSEDDSVYSAAIHSAVDLQIGGRGKLTVISENNKGIHSKKDLQVKNLTLFVSCTDNALKGNDGIEITDCTTTLIATKGDAIKTSDSDISEKGNQRGTVSIIGGTHYIYAACDGIDAAYDVITDGENTELYIFTDKYSEYSEEVTYVDQELYYIRFNYDTYKYSVKYYNSDKDFIWVDAEFHSEIKGGRSSYYYYSFPVIDGYSKIQYFIYDSEAETCRDEGYLAATDYMTVNENYDTFALSVQGGSLGYSFTNYTTTVQEHGGGGFGPGGFGGGGFGDMGGGNTEKGDYSTKGIKAGNEIVINDGTINVKSYDDALHANKEETLENGENPLGNITINGGSLTLYSNDDGIHADGSLVISDGTIRITHSFEGLEGDKISVSGGDISIVSSDDGINGTSTSDTSINISGGSIYIYCTGDGIDSNSSTSYKGIVFSGGKTVVISNSNMNSAIDSERGYSYTGGEVFLIMPSRGMSNEATNCQSFSSIATTSNQTISADSFVTVSKGNAHIVTVQVPVSLSARIIYLGSNSATVSVESSATENLDENGVHWN